MNYQAFYCHSLQESFQNYTCTNLSDSVGIVSHDKLTRYLGTYPVDEKSLFEKLNPETGSLPSNGYLIFDDTVLDKCYSHQISMVRRQANAEKPPLREIMGTPSHILCHVGME